MNLYFASNRFDLQLSVPLDQLRRVGYSSIRCLDCTHNLITCDTPRNLSSSAFGCITLNRRGFTTTKISSSRRRQQHAHYHDHRRHRHHNQRHAYPSKSLGGVLGGSFDVVSSPGPRPYRCTRSRRWGGSPSSGLADRRRWWVWGHVVPAAETGVAPICWFCRQNGPA